MSDPKPETRRFDCPTCQFAYECGSRAWCCDSCHTSRDLRVDSQFSLLRDDDSPNRGAVR